MTNPEPKEDRRKRDETPELDAMLFQREGDDKDG